MLIPLLISALVGYVLGALPFGYWVARSRGIDIFQHGSKNPGATNVRRVLGKGPGNLVFFLDALKGAVATGWPLLVTRIDPSSLIAPHALPCAVVGLISALVGHSFSCFTGFRGGKGVATSVGGFAVLLPWILLIAAVVWAVTFFTTRYVSLASMLAALTLPIAAFFFKEPALLLS
ncbi:MAG TPA: glycerol-3-phosphate acyltransferase, partial [Opitutaceae bacterium]|nr:glycerol-3-phosphate acyltransferase [Opitutaceae bacterium]